MMDHDGMGGFFGMGVGWLWWILIIVLIVVIVWVVLQRNRNNQIQAPKNESALETLEKRYANGEISTEEYREKKRELKS